MADLDRDPFERYKSLCCQSGLCELVLSVMVGFRYGAFWGVGLFCAIQIVGAVFLGAAWAIASQLGKVPRD